MNIPELGPGYGEVRVMDAVNMVITRSDGKRRLTADQILAVFKQLCENAPGDEALRVAWVLLNNEESYPGEIQREANALASATRPAKPNEKNIRAALEYARTGKCIQLTFREGANEEILNLLKVGPVIIFNENDRAALSVAARTENWELTSRVCCVTVKIEDPDVMDYCVELLKSALERIMFSPMRHPMAAKLEAIEALVRSNPDVTYQSHLFKRACDSMGIRSSDRVDMEIDLREDDTLAKMVNLFDRPEQQRAFLGFYLPLFEAEAAKHKPAMAA